MPHGLEYKIQTNVQLCKSFHYVCNKRYQDANVNIQKIERIPAKNSEVFKIMCNLNGTLLTRNREVAKFGCHNGQKCLQKIGSFPVKKGVGLAYLKDTTWFYLARMWVSTKEK